MDDASERAHSLRLMETAIKLAGRPYARRGVAVSAEPIRVLIVDNHRMIREGLRLLLRPAPDIVIVGEADDGVSSIALAQRLVPQVVLLDMEMQGGTGISALRGLTKALCSIRVLALTIHSERELLMIALDSGASGFLTKEGDPEDLVDAIRVVASGEIYVRPGAARMLASSQPSERTSISSSTRYNSLSAREQLVVLLVAQGFSGAEIARQLEISAKSVSVYKHRIRRKIGLDHRTEYVRFALEARVLQESCEQGQ